MRHGILSAPYGSPTYSVRVGIFCLLMPELPARAFPSATVLGEPTPQEADVRCVPPRGMGNPSRIVRFEKSTPSCAGESTECGLASWAFCRHDRHDALY